MDNNLLDELMQDTRSQFGNFRIPFYNGEESFYICAFAFLRFDFITEGSRYLLKLMLLFLVVGGELLKTLVRKFSRNGIFIKTLEDGVQFCDPLFSVGQCFLPFCQASVALANICIHNHLHKIVFALRSKGNDLAQILQNQFFQDNSSDGVCLPTYITTPITSCIRSDTAMTWFKKLKK